MTKKSKSLLVGSLLVGGLLVGAIAVTSTYVHRLNTEYATKVKKYTPADQVKVEPIEKAALPSNKLEEQPILTPSNATIKLKDLKGTGYTSVVATTSGKRFVAAVVDGKATLEMTELVSNRKYEYKVFGEKEDKSLTEIYSASLQTPAGAYFSKTTSVIGQSEAELHIAGMELYAGQIKPQFSIDYKIKDTSTATDTLNNEKLDKQMMISENVYIIKLENLLPDRTYTFSFGSEGKEILSGEFKTTALATTEN